MGFLDAGPFGDANPLCSIHNIKRNFAGICPLCANTITKDTTEKERKTNKSPSEIKITTCINCYCQFFTDDEHWYCPSCEKERLKGSSQNSPDENSPEEKLLPGIISEYLWKKARMYALMAVIVKYKKERKEPPIEWLVELKFLLVNYTNDYKPSENSSNKTL